MSVRFHEFLPKNQTHLFVKEVMSEFSVTAAFVFEIEENPRQTGILHKENGDAGYLY